MTLHGRLSMRRAGLSDVGAGGMSLDSRLRAVRPALTVPAAMRRDGGTGEHCEAQQKRGVCAFHGAPPWAAAPGFKE